MKKTIGILGSGQVGQTLADGFLKNGYKVMIGSRDASKLNEWREKAGPNALTGTFEETARSAEIIVLAVKGSAAKSALEMANAKNLDGKTIIDATNPIADAPPQNGVLQFFSKLDKSLMEELQQSFPQANFVKAFNSVGSPFMVDPKFESKPSMFICGNNDAAKKEVSEIIELFGWEATDFGKVESARAIEPLCMLWCIPGMLSNEWSHAFKLLRVS